MKKLILGLVLVVLFSVSAPHKAHAGLLSHILVGVVAHDYGVDSGKSQQQAIDAVTIADLNARIVILQQNLDICEAKLPVKKLKK